MGPALLLLAALANLVPLVVQPLVGGTTAAWEYVAYGLEAGFLWAFVFYIASIYPERGKMAAVAMLVSAWAAVEAFERPVCRLMFPMGKAPHLAEGESLCAAATGLNFSLFGILAALLIACIANELLKWRTK